MAERILQGRTVLIVEDEALIAFDIATVMEQAGALVTITSTLENALNLVEADGLSAAILDHTLPDGDSSRLYERLRDRGIPFVIYSGSPNVIGNGDHEAHVLKPVNTAGLVILVDRLIRGAAA